MNNNMLCNKKKCIIKENMTAPSEYKHLINIQRAPQQEVKYEYKEICMASAPVVWKKKVCLDVGKKMLEELDKGYKKIRTSTNSVRNSVRRSTYFIAQPLKL